MQAEVVTNVGLVRENNEDAVFCDLDRKVFIVADGMGGCAAGEVASTLAVETVSQLLTEKSEESPEETLRNAVYQANNRIYEAARENPQYAGMGTTITVSWILGNRVYLAHVGDSRAYLIRKKEITSLTKDHSFVGELMREGGLTEEQAMVHPQKNILTRALGCNPLIEADVFHVPFLPGDYLFLCTDGMSNLVNSEDILSIINSSNNIKTTVQRLVNLALERGGHDNITAILVAN
ncbi:MAG: Stp1/IreP family PP2C-type Ser/Thr phosphatase [Desulfitobacteriaceae bacterium]|nr:Stp1/IreP family PP2C-type Ser/Thr phosphatase [Desulfitobacteriaceae bacterium]